MLLRRHALGFLEGARPVKTYSKWLDSEDDWREVGKIDGENVTNLVTTLRKS